MEFSKRLDLFGDEIFAALNERKVALEAQGRTIYNLSVGTPDFAPAEHIRKAMMDAAADPQNWKYSLRDLPELLDAVCGYYKRRFHVEITPDQVASCAGSQEGVGHIGMVLCDEGDTVLLPTPCYPVFIAGSLLGGAKPWYYPLTKEHGFLPYVKDIPEDVARKAKYMIVSLPANPVGSVGSPELYAELVAFAKKYDILIIHDNAYSDIIFDGAVGNSFFNTPGAMDVGVEFFSLSKSFNVTGARISFLVGRRDVVAAFKKLRGQIDFGMFLPVQKAAIAALTGPLDMVKRSAACTSSAATLCAAACVPLAGMCRTVTAACSCGHPSRQSTQRAWTSVLTLWKRAVCCARRVPASAPWAKATCALPSPCRRSALPRRCSPSRQAVS